MMSWNLTETSLKVNSVLEREPSQPTYFDFKTLNSILFQMILYQNYEKLTKLRKAIKTMKKYQNKKNFMYFTKSEKIYYKYNRSRILKKNIMTIPIYF